MPLTLLAAGSNGKGQLGTGDCDDRHRFVKVLSWDDDRVQVVSFAAGANHTLLVVKTSEGASTIWAVGDNSRGQCDGTPSKEPWTTFRQLDPGALLASATGSSTQITVQPKLVAASWDTSFVALGPTEPQASGSDVVVSFGGSDFGERGCFRPPPDRASTVAIDGALGGLNTSFRVAGIKAGPRHAVASLRFQSPTASSPASALVGWGATRHGQLGPDAKVQTRSEPVFLTTPDHAFGLSRVRHSPVILPGVPAAADCIAVGKDHTALLSTADQTLHLLGSNKRGQLCGGKDDAVLGVQDLVGPGVDASARITRAACSWNSTFAVVSSSPSKDGADTVWGWGSNSHGQLGSPSQPASVPGDYHPAPVQSRLPPSRVLDLATGSEHVLALLEHASGAREVWAWGWNEHGNLGFGEPDDTSRDVQVPVPRKVDLPEGVEPVAVMAGCATSFILLRTP